jgi:hypothetical protein
MKKNPLNKGIIMENADGIGTVTPAMVEGRARKLALINGHGSLIKPFEKVPDVESEGTLLNE